MNHFQVTFKHPDLGEFKSSVETEKDQGFLHQNIKKVLDGAEPQISLKMAGDSEAVIPTSVANQGIWIIRQFLKAKPKDPSGIPVQCRKMLSDGKIAEVIETLKNRGIALGVFDVFDELKNSEDAADDKDAHIRRLQKRHGLIIGLLKGLDDLEESL